MKNTHKNWCYYHDVGRLYVYALGNNNAAAAAAAAAADWTDRLPRWKHKRSRQLVFGRCRGRTYCAAAWTQHDSSTSR
ncbi:hypothetical protein E2C01_074213 [Portunus trituberculatus]|uniref:Uncharacterized protein n=1 Tax=Portunus trituberculatus TaxID=210409 RepID=A0A5B7IBT4_PORTR|nr:hypothetical protein [Portunus trituberculatus]